MKYLCWFVSLPSVCFYFRDGKVLGNNNTGPGTENTGLDAGPGSNNASPKSKIAGSQKQKIQLPGGDYAGPWKW